MGKKAKAEAAKKAAKKSVTRSVSFHFDEQFRPYVPRLEVFAEGQGLDLGPAARELVRKALDLPTKEPQPASGVVLAEDFAAVRDATKALELTVKMTLEENRNRFDKLRSELAQVLRLAFLAFKDLEAEQVEELVRTVFKG
jgi:hypothetical protein